VRRVLKAMGHTVKVGRVRVRTTDSSHPHWRYPNLLKRLKPKYPNHVWVADITYLRLGRNHSASNNDRCGSPSTTAAVVIVE
jgi:hypothetical protein